MHHMRFYLGRRACLNNSVYCTCRIYYQIPHQVNYSSVFVCPPISTVISKDRGRIRRAMLRESSFGG